MIEAPVQDDFGARSLAGESSSSTSRIEIDVELAEAAVCRVLHHDLSHRFWRARDELLGHSGPSGPGAMAELSRLYFRELRLGAPIVQALAEQRLIETNVTVCRILRALRAGQEGAELYVNSKVEPPTRTLVVRLSAEAFGESDRLLDWLRHELFHIHDMLDPEFGYDPGVPEAEGGPLHTDLVIRRYRVLWDTVICGRLFRANHAGPDQQRRCRGVFVRTFGMLADPDTRFEEWFAQDHPRHRGLLEFAHHPSGVRPEEGALGGAVEICPLCHSPGILRHGANAYRIGADLLSRVQHDFPDWTWQDGLCSQCLDIYDYL